MCDEVFVQKNGRFRARCLEEAGEEVPQLTGSPRSPGRGIWRDRQAQGLRSLQVDDECKFTGLLDGEVSRLSPVEEFVHVHGEALPPIGSI
jgi:hypothetical protein